MRYFNIKTLKQGIPEKSRKVLLINYFYENYTGSEIVIQQLAYYFVSRGYDVTIGSFFIGDPLFSETHSNIKIINLVSATRLGTYDLVWAHHSTVLDYCFFHLDLHTRRVVLSLLSPYESMESLPIYYKKLDMIVVNSDETMRSVIEESNKKIKNLFLFPNAVADEYFSEIGSRTKLEKIVVISNHVPQELRDIEALFRKEEIKIDYIGKEDRYVRVTPALLKEYDLVITIGKTVQYCFALGIPVYVYDHFGGMGFLTEVDYHIEEKKNYSGRGSNVKKSSKRIVSEIMEGYNLALERRTFFQNLAVENYHFDTYVNQILAKIDKRNSGYHKYEKMKKEFSLVKKNSENYMKLLKNQIKNLNNNNLEIKMIIDDYEVSREYPIVAEGLIEQEIVVEEVGRLSYIRIDPVDNMKCLVKVHALNLKYIDSTSKYEVILDVKNQIRGNFLKSISDVFVFDTSDPIIDMLFDIPNSQIKSIFISYSVYRFDMLEKITGDMYNEKNIQ